MKKNKKALIKAQLRLIDIHFRRLMNLNKVVK